MPSPESSALWLGMVSGIQVCSNTGLQQKGRRRIGRQVRALKSNKKTQICQELASMGEKHGGYEDSDEVFTLGDLGK